MAGGPKIVAVAMLARNPGSSDNRIHANCVGQSPRRLLRKDQFIGEVKYPAMSMMMFGQPALLMRLIAPSEPSFTITMFGMV